MKTDRKLGLEVAEHLVQHGVETPITETSLTDAEKIELIRDNMEIVVDVLG